MDAFSPVSVSGEVNVLSAALYTDLKMNFRNIELSIFNPYSGKFAGYNITKGKLTTELHYKVDGRKLDAQHHIVIDQLEFGDKTASKDAVSLPVKLAVALLKDRNGVIDLNLPVAGSLDDPKFRLAPIIWKVLVNILEKAVTAPFALLGALFGGGPDIQFVDFQPGVSTLDAAAADKVKTIAKALNARPQLKIEVPIAVVPDIDRPALIAAQFNAQLQEVQVAGQSRKKPAAGAAAPAFEQLNPAAQLELLTELYTRDVGAQPKYPDAVAALKKARRRAGQDRVSDFRHPRASDGRRRRAQGAGRAARPGSAAGPAHRYAGRAGARLPGRERQGGRQGRRGAVGTVPEIAAWARAQKNARQVGGAPRFGANVPSCTTGRSVTC